MMSSWVDTILNINAFAFIGLLVWIYVKKFETDESDRPDR